MYYFDEADGVERELLVVTLGYGPEQPVNHKENHGPLRTPVRPLHKRLCSPPLAAS
jgi:hypothetical protein